MPRQNVFSPCFMFWAICAVNLHRMDAKHVWNILLDAAGSLQFCHLVGIATHSRTCLYMHPLEQTWTCKWLIGIRCRSNTISFFSTKCNERARHKRGSEHFNFRADKLLLHERCIGTPIATSPNQNPAKNWKFSTTKAAAAQLKDACLSFPMLGPVPQPPGKFRSVGKLIRVVNQKWNKSVQIVFAWYVDMSNMILISLFFVCAFLNSFVQHLVLKSIGCQFQCTVILVQVRHRFSTLGRCAWKIAKGGTWKAGGFVFGHSNNEGIAWYYYVVFICIWLYLKC